MAGCCIVHGCIVKSYHARSSGPVVVNEVDQSNVQRMVSIRKGLDIIHGDIVGVVVCCGESNNAALGSRVSVKRECGIDWVTRLYHVDSDTRPCWRSESACSRAPTNM